MTVPSGENVLGVYNDRDVETKHFRMPRYVDGNDLTDFLIRINYRTAAGETDSALADNVVTKEDEITFDWPISHKVCASAGTVPFSICARLLDGNEVIKEYNTTYYCGTVLPGIEPNGSNIPDDPEIIAQIEQYLAEIAELREDIQSYHEIQDDVAQMKATILEKIDDAYEEDGYLYLTSDGEIVAGPIGPFASSGGGSGGNNAILTVTNNTGWNSSTITASDDCYLSINWSSVETGSSTGPGTLKVLVGSSTKVTQDIAQGTITINVAPYLGAGTNIVKLRVTDVYGNTRTVSFTVIVVNLYVTSSFDASVPYTGAVQFAYTPVGNLTKTVYFKIDGSQIGVTEVTTSGRQQTFTIPAQTHGMHTFECYFTASVNGSTVTSNTLYYELICLEEGNSSVIITTDFHDSTVPQYTSLKIGYFVYNPSALTTPVKIYVTGDEVADLTADRTKQTFNYRVDTIGGQVIRIVAGSGSSTTTLTINLTVTESDIDVEAETQNLALYLTSKGRSNSETNRSIWRYENIQAQLDSFNWTSDGWQMDAEGETVLRVAGDARVTIPYRIFATDFRTTGKTIEVELATKNVMNYDATIMSCLSDDRGLKITPQLARLTSEQSVISTQFKDDEHVRIAFVVEKRTEQRLIYCYINGIMSGVIRYPDDDDFSQATPAYISIGSNSCTTDIYNIRVYDNDLTRYQLLDNWIADSQSIDDMLDRYNRNNVYDAYGQIVIEKLPHDLPYMVLQAPELPQYKGDKKTVSGYYVDPVNEANSFTFTDAQFDVQGTSSQYYARKNYKAKFKNGFVMNGDSTATAKYKLRSDSIPVNTFCFKADVASSEGANNVELVRLYNDACPYETPAQQEDARIRQGIDGFPIVIFWDDGTTVSFVGKYNFNNDKSTEDVFGFQEGDESWEILNNTSSRVVWKSDDYTGTAWLSDFEARYPDTDPAYTNNAQLKAFAKWIVSTDTTAATGNALSNSVVYDGVTYSNDTSEYRLAKFKAELGDWVELESAEFYYLFTELFLMVDSRAKNMFPSFMGSEV